MSNVVVKQGDTSEEILITADEIISTDPWTCTLTILDSEGVAALTRAVTTTNSAKTGFSVILSPQETTALAVGDYRMVVELTNVALSPDFNREDVFLLSVEPEMEVGDLTGLVVLVKGENSFDTYTNILNELAKLPHLKQAYSVPRNDLKAALAQAYENIGHVTTDFGVWDPDAAEYKTSTSELTSADLDALTAKERTLLVKAQLIEANALLGANPIEDRRRAGMLSDSVGESAIFFRTSKPLEMPIYRETALALRGYLVWSKQIGRG